MGVIQLVGFVNLSVVIVADNFVDTSDSDRIMRHENPARCRRPSSPVLLKC